MNLTQSQHDKINKHLDDINAYLCELQQNIYTPISFFLENSSIDSFTIEGKGAAWIYYRNESSALSFDKNPEYIKSIYDRPQVGYDILLNWNQIKKRLTERYEWQQEEHSIANNVIDTFQI